MAVPVSASRASPSIMKRILSFLDDGIHLLCRSQKRDLHLRHLNLTRLAESGPETALNTLLGADAMPKGTFPSRTEDRAEDLTFGCEFKFLVKVYLETCPGLSDELTAPRCGDGSGGGDNLKANVGNIIPSDHERLKLRARLLVKGAIKRACDLPVICRDELTSRGLQDFHLWGTHFIVKKANSAVPLKAELEGEAHSRTGPGAFTWVPVEISSPKLRALGAAGAANVQLVTDIITNVAADLEVAFNASCDFHVHIGHWTSTPLKLDTLKKLSVLLYLAEPILRLVRDPQSPNFDGVHTWAFETRKYSRVAIRSRRKRTTFGSRLKAICAGPTTHEVKGTSAAMEEPYLDPQAKKISSAQSLSAPSDDASSNSNATSEPAPAASTILSGPDLAAIELITSAPTHLALGRLLSGPVNPVAGQERRYRRLGFNYNGLGLEDGRGLTSPRTVEFRMFTAMGSIDLMMDWLAVCVALGEVSLEESAARYEAAVEIAKRALVGKKSSAVELAGEFHDLMEALGLPEEKYDGLYQRILIDYAGHGRVA